MKRLPGLQFKDSEGIIEASNLRRPPQNPGTNQYCMESFLNVGTGSQQLFNFFSCCYCSNSKLYCYCPVFVQLTFTGLWERIRVSWLFPPFLHKLLIKDILWMTKHCILCHTALTRLLEQQFKNTCLHCSLTGFFFFFKFRYRHTFFKAPIYHFYNKMQLHAQFDHGKHLPEKVPHS